MYMCSLHVATTSLDVPHILACISQLSSLCNQWVSYPLQVQARESMPASWSRPQPCPGGGRGVHLERLHVLEHLVGVLAEALLADRHAHQADALQRLCPQHLVALVVGVGQDLPQQRHDLRQAQVLLLVPNRCREEVKTHRPLGRTQKGMQALHGVRGMGARLAVEVDEMGLGAICDGSHGGEGPLLHRFLPILQQRQQLRRQGLQIRRQQILQTRRPA